MDLYNLFKERLGEERSNQILQEAVGKTYEELLAENNRLLEENADLKRDNGFYQRHMDITRAVLNKSGFVCQTVSEEEIEKCNAQFIVEYNADGMIQLYRKMTLGDFDEEEN